MLSRPAALFLLAAALLLSAGCGKGKAAAGSLDPEENFARAENYMAARKYNKAITWFQRVNTTRDEEMRARVHLRLADAYFEQGNVFGLAEAQGRYQSFLNAFPLSDQAAYAQYRYARCLQRQIHKPERDQTPTYRAMGEFRKVAELYPSSPWVAEARQRMEELEDHLSRDALIKVRFYTKRKAWAAAEDRLRGLLAANPDWQGRDEALYLLGRALRRQARSADADAVLREVVSDFPHTKYGRKAAALLDVSDGGSEEPGAAAGG